jgi:hypothetical protein
VLRFSELSLNSSESVQKRFEIRVKMNAYDNYLKRVDGIAVDKGSTHCKLCFDINQTRRFKISTSTGTLKKHLTNYHNISLEYRNDSTFKIKVSKKY